MNRNPNAKPHRVADAASASLKTSWPVVKDVAMHTGRDHLSVVAAGCAYYALFAIFPALTAAISLYGLTANPETVDKQFGILETVLPPQAYSMVLEHIQRIAETSGQALGWSFLAGLLIALWSANHATQAMFHALNNSYGEPERRGFMHFYVSAVGYTLIAILGCVAMLFAIVYVPLIFDDTGHSQAYHVLLRYLRWPAFILLTLFLLALVYRYGPSRPGRDLRWISPGSIFATLVWLAASLGFSYYVSNFGHYDRMYGSLGAVIILLFWFYMSFYIVLLGAEINGRIERAAEQDDEDAPHRS